MNFSGKGRLWINILAMVAAILIAPKILIGTLHWSQRQIWKYDVASVGKKCAPNDVSCRLNAVNVLKTPTLDDSTLRATKRQLISDIWQDTRDDSLTAEDLRIFVGYARGYGDSELVESVCLRYFADKQPTFRATLGHFEVVSDYLGSDRTDLNRYWREKTVDQAIDQLTNWDDAYKLLDRWALIPKQKAAVLDYAVASPNKTLSDWWYIQQNGKVRWDSKHTDVHWSEQAADSIIAKTDDLAYLKLLAETANPRQILAMVHRLNNWPDLTAEQLVSWINAIPDLSIAYRVLQDQAARRTNEELVDAYNATDDEPIKNRIILILSQRVLSREQWQEIFLRAAEGSRLMALAASASSPCGR